MTSKLKEKNIVRVGVYLGDEELTSIIKDAEKAGFRRMGLPARIKKEHGLQEEWVANLDGISVFLKECWAYWRKNEPERLRQLAEVQEQERLLAARKYALERGRV